jgi:Asp-tRNA(Asn)/Glu-tRNA(Gln) amidotransferase A subunit family amidase
MVRLAVGSQTIGSIGRPASFCGVVGFKPTYERMPREGLTPFSRSVDTVGFFTASMDDMQTACAAFFDKPEADTPSPLRVGVIEDMLCESADGEMLDALREVAMKLEAYGFDVRPGRLPDDLSDAYENHLTLIASELALAHCEWFERYQAYYPPKLRKFILTGQRVSPGQLEQCLGRRAELEAELAKVFDEFDLVLTPSAAGAAPKGLANTGDPRMNLIFSHTRTPSLTLPARLNRTGLPLGVQLAARRMNDVTLLDAGLQIEAAIGFDARIPS